MNMKKFMAQHAFPMICAAFITVIIAGCGDESSNSTPTAPVNTLPVSSAVTDPLIPGSSASVPVDDCIANPALPQCQSQDPEDPVPGSSATDPNLPNPDVPVDSPAVDNPTNPTAVAVNRDVAAAIPGLLPDSNGFYDVGDIYKAVPAESKIVFVLRHAERESGLGKESPLTELGQQQALDVGAKLASDESFYYASTDFLRTRTTAQNIATGHGETGAEVVTWSGIDGGYFLTVPSDTLDALVSSRGGSFKYVSQWAYGEPFTNNYVIQHGIATYFYDLFERGDQFINEVILANLPNWKRVNVLITHDLLTEPLAVYASNRTVNLRTYEADEEGRYRWINYVAGIAVVVDASGLVTVLPAKGVELGFLNTREMKK